MSENLGVNNIILEFKEDEITVKELIDKIAELYGEKFTELIENTPTIILVGGKLGDQNTRIKNESEVFFMIPYAGG